jgi:hypothetical protein
MNQQYIKNELSSLRNSLTQLTQKVSSVLESLELPAGNPAGSSTRARLKPVRKGNYRKMIHSGAHGNTKKTA